jgi:DNA-binding response OmpR family regulator
MVVLIVDDEPSVAGTLASVFRRAGFRSFWVSGAVKAFLLAQEINPDLLLADVMMPDFNGIELAIRFRSEFPDCKILLMSGQAETDDLLERAKEQGYDFQVVAKPIWPPDLLTIAEKVLGVHPNEKQTNARAQSAQSTTKLTKRS